MFSSLFHFKGDSGDTGIVAPRWKAFSDQAQQSRKIFRLKNRALSKTLKFRAVTLVTTLAITWLLTGNAVTSVGLTVIQQGTNTAVYYFFEKNEKHIIGRLKNN